MYAVNFTRHTGTPPREKKSSEPDGTVLSSALTIGGGLRKKVLAGAAFWSFGTSKLGFSLLEPAQW